MPAKNRPTIRNFIAQDASKSRIGEICMRGYIGESNQGSYDFWSGTEVEAWGAGTVKEIEAEIDALNVDEIHLLITSEGGSFFDAMTIADILNRHPAKIVAIVEGYAFSAATVLICKCADEIRIAANGYMMIHNAEVSASGNAQALMVAANLAAKTSGTIAGIYAARGGGDVPFFQEKMDAETYFDGTECVAAKLADNADGRCCFDELQPHALRIRNAKTRDKMPAAIRAVFDSEAPSSMTTPVPPAAAAAPVPPNPPALGVHNTANPPAPGTSAAPAAAPAALPVTNAGDPPAPAAAAPLDLVSITNAFAKANETDSSASRRPGKQAEER